MAKRSALTLEDIADWDNLCRAVWRAGRGKRSRPEVRRFRASLDSELRGLRAQILSATVPADAPLVFEVRDPKRRTIHAPSFRHRVLHHALMAKLGPVIQRSLVDDTFACIEGRGTLAAVHRAQAHTGRHPWYVKIDIAGYFASIPHFRLRLDLERRFKNRGVLRLCDAILAGFQTAPGRGLPIGALTSQHFANAYLGPLDRFLLETLKVRGMVRYMDDTVWWCDSRAEAMAQFERVTAFVEAERGLSLKAGTQINRSEHGVTLCGFRVRPRELRLSQRRRRRYRIARRRAELAYRVGEIDAQQLQARYAAALAITAHAQAQRWRRAELNRRPTVDA